MTYIKSDYRPGKLPQPRKCVTQCNNYVTELSSSSSHTYKALFYILQNFLYFHIRWGEKIFFKNPVFIVDKKNLRDNRRYSTSARRKNFPRSRRNQSRLLYSRLRTNVHIPEDDDDDYTMDE